MNVPEKLVLSEPCLKRGQEPSRGAVTLLTYGGDASRGWGSPPSCMGQPRREPPWLCGVVVGHREAWIKLNLAFSSPLGNTVYQNIKLASFSDQPDGILPVYGS